MPDYSSHASHRCEIRARKARKVHELVASRLGTARVAVLDVGTGSGAMAAYFSSLGDRFDVHAIDVRDQRSIEGAYRFSVYDGTALPFAERTFDLVVSNHVLEHVNGRDAQAFHVREMLRVLRPQGSVYLACPSRWQFIEPHFRLPVLSWLPRGLRDYYVRVTGKGSRYDCDPLSPWELEQVLRDAGARYENVTFAAAKLFAREPGLGARVASLMIAVCPKRALERLSVLSPTMVYLVTHG